MCLFLLLKIYLGVAIFKCSQKVFYKNYGAGLCSFWIGQFIAFVAASKTRPNKQSLTFQEKRQAYIIYQK